MTCYSVQPRDGIFVKGYRFLSFAKNTSKIGKNESKMIRVKFNQKLVDYAKQSTKDALKTTSKRAIQKMAEASGDLICNKTAYKTKKISKTLKHFRNSYR